MYLLCISDISNSSFVQFQIWDFPGQVDFLDPTFDSDNIFGGCGALIFVVDAQVGTALTTPLTLMLVVANLGITKWYTKPEKWLKPRHMGTHLRVLSPLTLMLVVANLGITKWYTKPEKWLKPRHMGTHLRVLSPLTLMLVVANLGITKWYTKPEKWLKPRHMGTHLRVLSESYSMNTNMTGIRCFSKKNCILVLWMKVFSALETSTSSDIWKYLKK